MCQTCDRALITLALNAIAVNNKQAIEAGYPDNIVTIGSVTPEMYRLIGNLSLSLVYAERGGKGLVSALEKLGVNTEHVVWAKRLKEMAAAADN